VRTFVFAASVLAVLLAPAPSAAQVDFTVFLGRAFPIYDERLTLRPSLPALPGIDVTATQAPVLSADGGLVLGAALAFEAGIIGIEGRLDSTEVGLDFTGARYDLRASGSPFTAVLEASPGTFEADRINLLSLNVRLRTPGPIALVVSGGLSYLPDISITGSVPIRFQFADAPPVPELNAALGLRATPGEDGDRFGVNAGAGLRFGGRVGLMAEARVFYFNEYELRFFSGEEVFDDLLGGLDPIRFTPVFFNVQAGLVFRF
jgi:hypothetical protein